MEKKLVVVCGWCPDSQEQAAAARAHGFDVTHGICAACEEKMNQQAEERKAKKEQQS